MVFLLLNVNNIFLGQYPVSLGSLSEACFPEDIHMAVKNMSSEDKREKKGKHWAACSDGTASCRVKFLVQF